MINGVTHAAIGLGGKDGIYYVLDRVTGSLLEKFQIGTGSGEGGIIGLPGFIYLGANNPELFIGSYNTVVGGDYGVVKALTPADGSIKWLFNTPGTVVGQWWLSLGLWYSEMRAGTYLHYLQVREASCSTPPFRGVSWEASRPPRGSCLCQCASALEVRAESTRTARGREGVNSHFGADLDTIA